MNHDEIRAALAAATPGPWDAKPLGSEGYAVTGAPDPDAPAARDWRAEANQLTDADAFLLRAEKRAGRLPGISAPQAEDKAHAERVAWRVIFEWLRAQMTLVASRMVTLDQVMLPYLVVDGDRSLYAAYRESGLRELTGGAS